MGYIYCNGFALVFSVAAICAVLIGPFILVCLGRPTWRKQIATLAIVHLAFSLLSFLAAFVLAGYITAQVNAPPFNCANLKCEEGGVPCSAYTVRRNGTIYACVDHASGSFREVGSSNSTLGACSRGGGQSILRPLFELVLDPAVAQLNNDTFGDGHEGETPEVVCRDYRYLANNSFPDGGPVFDKLSDTRGTQTAKACFVLLDAISISPLNPDPQGPAKFRWHNIRPHAHALWCSTDRSIIGPGWLPLTLRTGLSLMPPEALLGTPYADLFEVSNAPEPYALEGPGGPRCPRFNFNTTVSIGDFGPGLEEAGSNPINMAALQLIPEEHNAWDEVTGVAKYDFPGDHAYCNSQVQSQKVNQVFWYADSLGWDRSGYLLKPSRYGEDVDSAVCLDRPYNSTPTNNRPLQGAKLYASLRYQCSSLSKGVLCDFGVDPPLAVDPDGSYLSKSNLWNLPDVVLNGTFQTARSVEWAVRGMVVAAVVSNAVSVITLTCWVGPPDW